MAADRFFGFDLIQRKTLAERLAEVGGAVAFANQPGTVADATGTNLQAILEDLAARIEVLESA